MEEIIWEQIETRPRFSSAWKAHVVNGCRRACFYCSMEKKLRDVPTTEAVQS